MSRTALRAPLLSAALGLGALWLPTGAILAHPLDPALLEIEESEAAPVRALWRVPAVQPRGAPLRPVLPGRCQAIEPAVVTPGQGQVSLRWRLDCGGRSLAGEEIAVEGLAARHTEALVRLRLADGRLVQAVLRGDAPSLVVPHRAGPARVLLDYAALGFDHILEGLDHLLFVLGLVLLVDGRRRLLATVTAFTAGHSITLSLAVLGLLRVPPAPVEALIAASILAVAVELARKAEGRAIPLWRSPPAVALAFGLLHGLGFAGALARVGLPAEEIPLALLAFNGGIELGQLLFVVLILLVRARLAALPLPWPRAALRLPAYGIGSLAAFWVFERI